MPAWSKSNVCHKQRDGAWQSSWNGSGKCADSKGASSNPRAWLADRRVNKGTKRGSNKMTPHRSELKACRFRDVVAGHPDYKWDDSIDHLINQFHYLLLPGLQECLQEYFFCRRLGCGMLCREVDWVRNDMGPYENTVLGGNWYLCPCCGKQYRPWRASHSYYPANKIWIVTGINEGLDEVGGPAARDHFKCGR